MPKTFLCMEIFQSVQLNFPQCCFNFLAVIFSDANRIEFHGSHSTPGLLLLFGFSSPSIGIIEVNNLTGGMVEVINGRSIGLAQQFFVYSLIDRSETYGVGIVNNTAYFEVFNANTREFQLQGSAQLFSAFEHPAVGVPVPKHILTCL